MKKILIVEDEAMLRDVYATLFKFEKFEVQTAMNGQVAVEKLKEWEPDIIILDLLMPVMNGIEFLEATNMPKNYPKVRVLVLSNLSDAATLDKITNLGATKYVLKASISPGELVNVVRQLVVPQTAKQLL